MNILQKTVLSLSLAVAMATPAFADVTQSLSHSGTDQIAWTNGGVIDMGGVTLASGTNTISALTSSVTLVDQGWGNTDLGNGVYVGLYQGAANVFSLRIAGATHVWATDQFNIANDNALLGNLNSALRGLSRNPLEPLSLHMYTNAYDYPGWELHTRDNSFRVTSGVSAVPEADTYAMLLAGLGVVGFMARRRKAVCFPG